MSLDKVRDMILEEDVAGILSLHRSTEDSIIKEHILNYLKRECYYFEDGIDEVADVFESMKRASEMWMYYVLKIVKGSRQFGYMGVEGGIYKFFCTFQNHDAMLYVDLSCAQAELVFEEGEFEWVGSWAIDSAGFRETLPDKLLNLQETLLNLRKGYMTISTEMELKMDIDEVERLIKLSEMNKEKELLLSLGLEERRQ